MKIALCFRFAQTFWLSLLSRGQFLQITEKSSRFKSIEQGHTEGTFFHYRVKFLLCALLGQAPNPKSKIKNKNGTRFARVFSKAKAHDS